MTAQAWTALAYKPRNRAFEQLLPHTIRVAVIMAFRDLPELRDAMFTSALRTSAA